MFIFTDPKVAAKYDTEFVNNPEIHIPGGDVLEGGWKGRLSTIPLAFAERAIQMKSNILFVKEETGDVEAPPIEAQD